MSRAALACLLVFLPDATWAAGAAVSQSAAPAAGMAVVPPVALQSMRLGSSLAVGGGLMGAQGVLPSLDSPQAAFPDVTALSPRAQAVLGPVSRPASLTQAAPSPSVRLPAPAVRPAGFTAASRGTPAGRSSAGLDRKELGDLDKMHEQLSELPALPASKAGGLESWKAVAQSLQSLFDGQKVHPGAVTARPMRAAVPSQPVAADETWRHGNFVSEDGAVITYRSRPPVGAQRSAPELFVGGMALADSYDPYFATGRDEGSYEYQLTLRGLPPTGWHPTSELFTADAKDLARMIVMIAQETRGGKVDLVLHSYGTLVFQRMMQLGDDPTVARALKLLKGARVVFIGGATHYGNSEAIAGAEFEQIAKILRIVMLYIDQMDSYGAALRASTRINPLLIPTVEAWMATWTSQRESLLALGSYQGIQVLLGHLSEPWDPEIDYIRQRMVAQTVEITKTPGWQEAMLRRANETSQLEFTKADVARIRRLGIHIDILFGTHDQLVPWASQRVLLEMFGFKAPEEKPEAGAVLQDRSGLFRFMMYEGDHYMPLKAPAILRDVLAQ